MQTELERLANKTLEYLCKKYPYNDQIERRAWFEVFRNEIVSLEYCEHCERMIKMNIGNGMRLLNEG